MSTNVEEEEPNTSITKPKADLSQIPEEIWLEIFQSASGISHQSAGLGVAPKLLSFPVLAPLKPSHKRKAFLRRFILVCKWWYRIALPFLYQNIVISNSRELRKLSQISSFASLYTRRLDVVMSFEDSGSIERKMFMSLIQRLTNLRILMFDHRYFRRAFFQKILALPDLRVLDSPRLTSHRNGLAFTNTTIHAVTLPLLLYDYSNPQGPVVVLPNLRQVYMRDRIHLTPTRSILLNGNFPSVTSILIGPECFEESYAFLFTVISQFHFLQYIGIQCSFVDLNSHFNHLSTPPPIFQVPATVHTLGFSFTQPKAGNRTYRELCNTIKQIHGNALRVIRFGEQTMIDLRERPFVCALVNETLQARGWELEWGDVTV